MREDRLIRDIVGRYLSAGAAVQTVLRRYTVKNDSFDSRRVQHSAHVWRVLQRGRRETGEKHMSGKTVEEYQNEHMHTCAAGTQPKMISGSRHSEPAPRA